jgi:multidrug efflux pump subunit AcrA (membrane-fusion protein)
VELGQSVENGVVVLHGLQAGERVVVEGIANIHGSGKVRVMLNSNVAEAPSGTSSKARA